MCLTCVSQGLLSRETYRKIIAFLETYPQAEWGPAHIVLSDQNLLDDHIKWCIALTKAALSRDEKDLPDQEDIKFMEEIEWYKEHSKKELTATTAFLEELLVIPENDR